MPSGKEDDKTEPEMKADNIISENQQKATKLLHPQKDEGSLSMIMCITCIYNMSIYGQCYEYCYTSVHMYVHIYAKQKHLGCKKSARPIRSHNGYISDQKL